MYVIAREKIWIKFNKFIFVLVSVVLSTYLVVVPSAPAKAAVGSDFNAGNIISDSLFFDGYGMSSSQIQSFLNSQVPTCTINNGQASHAAGAPYYNRDGSINSYIADKCLKNYTETTPSMGVQYNADGVEICKPYVGKSNQIAAEIIANIGIACSINPKVLLVLLQKEQSLVSDSWPTRKQFTEATGFECYDNGEPCVGVNAGFFKQVWSAARQFQRYGTGNFTWYPVGAVSQIKYQANKPECGTKSVLIANRATAALYYYTPYTPNEAALSNLYGTGDGCSAYGNRNFWRMYVDWFGKTIAGDSPVVYAVKANGDFWYFPGNSQGKWGAYQQIGTGWQTKTSIVDVSDFNGDGARDLIALDKNGSLNIYPTDGKVGWKSQQFAQIASGWDPNVALISTGDFDGDRKSDVISRDVSGRLWLHKGNGAAGLAAPVQIGNGWSSFTSIIGVSDWDGDGKPDLIARTSAGALWLYPGNGKGGWTGGQRQIGNGWSAFSSVSFIGDFDGDGFNDLSARTASGEMKLYRGNGRGGFLGSQTIGTGWNGFSQIVKTGTDNQTVVTPKAYLYSLTASGDLTYHPGNNSKGWGESRVVKNSLQTKKSIVDVGDFDSDGLRDLIMLDQSGSVDLFSTDGQYGWKSGTPRQIASGWDPNVALISTGDFDGDRKSDVISRDVSGRLWLHKGNGAAGLAAPVQIGNGWSSFTSIIGVSDWDGDGKPDLIARTSAGALWLYPGNGKGGWTGGQRQIGNGWSAFSSVSFIGDFDGDGFNDLSARTASGEMKLYRGNGRGGFLGSQTIGTGWVDKATVIGRK